MCGLTIDIQYMIFWVVTYTLNKEALICMIIVIKLSTVYEIILGISKRTKLYYFNITYSVLLVKLEDGNRVEKILMVNI